MLKKFFAQTKYQLTILSPFKRFLIAFIIVCGFYAWIVAGYGLVGKLEKINIAFAGRASDYSLER